MLFLETSAQLKRFKEGFVEVVFPMDHRFKFKISIKIRESLNL